MVMSLGCVFRDTLENRAILFHHPAYLSSSYQPVREKKDVPLGPEDPKEEDGSFDYRWVISFPPWLTVLAALTAATGLLHPHTSCPLDYCFYFCGSHLAECMHPGRRRSTRTPYRTSYLIPSTFSLEVNPGPLFCGVSLTQKASSHPAPHS